LLESYWQIGKLIVEDEQKGASRAAYGEAVLKNLSIKLTQEFGKGFDFTNLTNMRKFYQAFPILDAVRQELSWTYYRIIARMETQEKRSYYIQQSIGNGWNSRQLERNVHTLYFERSVTRKHSKKMVPKAEKLLVKDPYIFEFFSMNTDEKLTVEEICGILQ